MPPRIRTRGSKAQKENIGTGNKVKSKEVTTTTKAPRRALTDKTNSASDDNSFEDKEKKTVTKSSNADSKQITECNDDVRPRRDRRLPNRFVENGVLTTLCSTKNNVASRNASTNGAKPATTKTAQPSVQTASPDKSIFETSSCGLNLKAENSLVVCRPRRICRLPSRFNDHSISPNKFIPLQPQNASTPIQQNKVKVLSNDKHFASKKNKSPKKQTTAPLPPRSPRLAKTNAINKDLTIEISADTNNNAKPNSTKTKKSDPPSPKRVRRQQNTIKSCINECLPILPSPATKKINHKVINDATLKRVNTKVLEIKMLGCNKYSPKRYSDKNQDIYEFTFDPDEEPQPQKKKRKKPAIKKAPKVTKTIKTTYDQNISKALAALKDALKNYKDKQPPTNLPQIQETEEYDEPNNLVENSTVSSINKTLTPAGGNSSIRIEDIAADMEATADNDVDLNYSPVNSPHPKLSVTPNTIHEPRKIPEIRVGDTDPLNLQEDISFFDDIPVANSSMNTSVRHPLASPWRVEFNDLPIKWHVNTYVKPNMTPAVECSFIGSEESNKKKHVYTNIVPEDNDPLPMISEVTEKKAQMRKRRYGSPSKVNPSEISHISGHTSKKVESKTLNKDSDSDHNTSEEVSTNNSDLSNEKEKLKEKQNTRKRKNYENTSDKLSKSPEKQKTKDCTYFGFDESEDQENLTANKAKQNARCLRLRPRPVLQEINGPVTTVLPVAVKSKITTSSEAVNKAFEGLKSAEDAPVFFKNTEVNITNNDDLSLNDDSQSVHLFEDIEVVHYVKPTRKSYGNNKKVTFCQQPTSANDLQDNAQNNDDNDFDDDECSDDDDFGDFTFEILNIKEKKKVKKKKPKKVVSKKEEKEAEEWAAGFNSICEEIEEFPLVVE